MKWYIVISLFLLALTAIRDVKGQLSLAEPCDEEACQLPDCRCTSPEIPGGLSARNTPQFVLVTFDDAVNVLNIETYREILYGRRNSDGCPSGVTFYVNHEYTNYQLVNELYNQGFEIALHSMSHQNNQTYWQSATYEDMVLEFADQRIQMAHFANIPISTITGVRIPFLQMTGNATFQVMKEYGLDYDITWPTNQFRNPGLWPYTLDYASTQDCIIPPCPTASIPGTWVTPMISWVDRNGFFCSMVDSCFAVPPLDDEDDWFNFIVTNFEHHYLGNRSPFGFYIHEWYLRINPAVMRALNRFMNLVNNLNDAFMVNAQDVIDWVKNPIPVDEYIAKQCNPRIPAFCPASNCGPLESTHTEMSYWMQICNTCPARYPWLGNPLGQ